MSEYKVIEVVRETLKRERTWEVSAISEQDAIRQIIEGEAAEGYLGKHVSLESSTATEWIVDGMEIVYEHHEAIAQDDGIAEIGGHH